jgi:glycosyltransferase involved in cell wall biosynthesis
MKLYYRISDKSYEKHKLIGTTKETCFTNFCKVFSDFLQSTTIIADNCTDSTIDMLKSSGLLIIETKDGNAGSFRTALNLAVENAEDELLYFCEDDYFHNSKSSVLLQEGIKRADYVTLYDHPDKYTRFYDGGEFSKVIKTNSSHWRYTTSTCMTFGTKVKTLKQDMKVWNEFTSEDHPYDHFIFKKLTEEKKRRLAVCIPGAACHLDLTFSETVHHMLIEPWAIEMMIEQMEKNIEVDLKPSIFTSSFREMKDALLKDRTGLERLIALDALFKEYY